MRRTLEEWREKYPEGSTVTIEEVGECNVLGFSENRYGQQYVVTDDGSYYVERIVEPYEIEQRVIDGVRHLVGILPSGKPWFTRGIGGCYTPAGFAEFVGMLNRANDEAQRRAAK